MSGEAILTVGAAVVACVQLLKWAGLQGRDAPDGVMVPSLLGVAIWAWDQGGFVRGMAFSYLSGWISIALTAAGVFGFARETPDVVTSLTKAKWQPGDPERRG